MLRLPEVTSATGARRRGDRDAGAAVVSRRIGPMIPGRISGAAPSWSMPNRRSTSHRSHLLRSGDRTASPWPWPALV